MNYPLWKPLYLKARHNLNLFTYSPVRLVRPDFSSGYIRIGSNLYTLEDIIDMASPKRGKAAKSFSPMEFFNYKFTSDEKKQFDKWLSSGDDVTLKAVHETAQSGHKIGISWDTERSCFIAALTGKEDSLNPGKCVLIRAAAWERAIFGAAFFHVVISDGEIWDLEGSDDVL